MSEPNPPLASSTFELYRPVEVFVAPPPPRRRYWLHALLLVLTIFSTLVVGARLQYNFDHNLPAFPRMPDIDLPTLQMIVQIFLWWFPVQWVLQHPARLLSGLPFSATLLFILLSHEMGHFLYCLRYRVWATLPFFIPAPTLIGTFGAFIRIRSPIRSRAALFDIGIAGPIAGFLVAVPVLAFALTFSKPMAMMAVPAEVQLGYPLIFNVVRDAVLLILPAGNPLHLGLRQISLHPTAIAAWVGMFATALNLLPGGQLDGGHIVYSVAPRLHRPASWVSAGLLVLLAVSGFWMGWLLWSVLLMATGMRHPQVPVEPTLGPGRKLLAIFAVLMLVLTFTPAPLAPAGMLSLFR
jgi:membrane-associated protease RseP (regulator of RpoE activity)